MVQMSGMQKSQVLFESLESLERSFDPTVLEGGYRLQPEWLEGESWQASEQEETAAAKAMKQDPASDGSLLQPEEQGHAEPEHEVVLRRDDDEQLRREED